MDAEEHIEEKNKDTFLRYFGGEKTRTRSSQWLIRSGCQTGLLIGDLGKYHKFFSINEYL